MKPFKPGVVVTKERLGFTQLPETDAEGQVAVRQFQTQAPIGPGQAGVVNAQGAIPAVVEYKSMAGELANSIKSSCAHCKHFDVKAWRQFVAAATGPAASAEAKQTIQTMKARIMMAGYGFEDEEGGVERTVMHHGICRPLSDWVEAQVKRDPVWWPVVCWKEASCPSYVRAGSAELPVVTPAEPLGFFTPRDLDAEKQGEKGYDNILFNAAGKPR